MALPKPQLNGDVLDYDEKQTEEINAKGDRLASLLPKESIVESIRTNGSNLGGYTGAAPLTLPQAAALPILWTGLIKISAISSTTSFFGIKFAASNTGVIGVFLLTDATSYKTYIAVLQASTLLSFKEI